MPLRTGGDFASRAGRAFAGQRHGLSRIAKAFHFRRTGSRVAPDLQRTGNEISDMIINDDVVEAIGNTPLTELKRVSEVDKLSQAVMKTEYPEHDKSKQRLD